MVFFVKTGEKMPPGWAAVVAKECSDMDGDVSAQDHGTDKSVDQDECPGSEHAVPHSLHSALDIGALCGTHLANQVGGGIHGAGETGCSQHSNGHAAHGHANVGSHTAEHIEDDLDFSGSGSLDTEAADHGSSQHICINEVPFPAIPSSADNSE